MLNIKNLKFALTVLILMHHQNVMANKETASIVIETNFSNIYSKIITVLQSKYPSVFFKSCEEAVGLKYKCGEVPYGDILAENEKSIMEVKLPSKDFSSGGFNGTFPEAKFPIYISRKQHEGATISEKLITEPDSEMISSKYFGKDFYVRLFSQNNQMFARACLYSPGVSIESERQEIKFRAKKKTSYWLFSVTTSIDVKTKIYVSPYSFKAMKSCADIKVTPKMVGSSLTYETKIIAISYPQTFGLEKGKIDISVDSSGGNFLGSVINFFANDKIEESIKKSIESKLGGTLNKVDIENGVWVEKLTKDSYDKLFTNNLSQKLSEALAKNHTPKVKDLGIRAHNRCLSKVRGLKLPGLEVLKNQLMADCKDFENITLQSFIPNAKSSDLGCYTNFTRLTDIDPVTKPNYKILNDCKFEHKIEIRVKPYMKPLANCVLNHLKEGSEVSCVNEIAGLITTAQ